VSSYALDALLRAIRCWATRKETQAIVVAASLVLERSMNCPDGLFDVLADEIHRLADGRQLLGVLVADLQAKLLLQRHDQLDQIQ
jgi:hypothetical protein